jgi:hypothetical protein
MTKPLNAEKLLEKGVNEWEKITAAELNALRIHLLSTYFARLDDLLPEKMNNIL